MHTGRLPQLSFLVCMKNCKSPRLYMRCVIYSVFASSPACLSARAGWCVGETHLALPCDLRDERQVSGESVLLGPAAPSATLGGDRELVSGEAIPDELMNHCPGPEARQRHPHPETFRPAIQLMVQFVTLRFGLIGVGSAGAVLSPPPCQSCSASASPSRLTFFCA